MNRLILPAKYQTPIAPQELAATEVEAVESVGDTYCQHVQNLVDSGIKDLSGGLLPKRRIIQKFLKATRHSNGVVFEWRKRPMLFVSHPKFRTDASGKVLMDVQSKKLYMPDNPPMDSNN